MQTVQRTLGDEGSDLVDVGRAAVQITRENIETVGCAADPIVIQRNPSLATGVVTPLADNGLGSFAVPGIQLAAWLLVAAIAGLLASLRPASKAAKLNVLEAISHD